MKKISFKFALLALAVSAFVACDDENSSNNVAKDVYWSGDVKISAPVVIESGATLTIEAGTNVTAEDNGEHIYILIAQGAKIDAQGTAAEPIIMTAEDKSEGAWGGIHICGYATVNTGSNSSEVGSYPYGGSKDDDNSGVLSYVVIEYAGYLHSAEKEANGFTFYGVGSGTQVDHCVAYKGADDGFEWFGGTVNGTYLVSIGNQDDAFDWTEGWKGAAQFLIADQIQNGCDQTIEGDNSKVSYLLEPISCPTIVNATLIGDDNGSDTSGALLRNGTYFKIYNTIASGKSTDIRISDVSTEKADSTNVGTYPTSASLEAASSLFKNVYTGSYKDDKTTSSYTFDGVNGNSVVSQAAYDYATTVASSSHG
ncbi:MAG: hypothetical protein R3Y38_03900, partial [Rikenellaceae bacterium]